MICRPFFVFEALERVAGFDRQSLFDSSPPAAPFWAVHYVDSQFIESVANAVGFRPVSRFSGSSSGFDEGLYLSNVCALSFHSLGF